METPLSPASVGRDRDVPARIPLSDTGLLPLLFAVAMAALGLAGLFLASRADSDYVETAGLSRSEEHTSELQSLMRISYAVFCLQKKKNNNISTNMWKQAT